MAQRRFLEKLDRKVIRSDRALLAVLFPCAFMREKPGVVKTPLKLGIHNDIITRGMIDPKTGHKLPAIRVKAALWSYCNSPQYHASIVIGGRRVDLDGNEAGEITDAQRAFSQEWLKRYSEKQQKLKQEAA